MGTVLVIKRDTSLNKAHVSAYDRRGPKGQEVHVGEYENKRVKKHTVEDAFHALDQHLEGIRSITEGEREEDRPKPETKEAPQKKTPAPQRSAPPPRSTPPSHPADQGGQLQPPRVMTTSLLRLQNGEKINDIMSDFAHLEVSQQHLIDKWLVMSGHPVGQQEGSMAGRFRAALEDLAAKANEQEKANKKSTAHLVSTPAPAQLVNEAAIQRQKDSESFSKEIEHYPVGSSFIIPVSSSKNMVGTWKRIEVGGEQFWQKGSQFERDEKFVRHRDSIVKQLKEGAAKKQTEEEGKAAKEKEKVEAQKKKEEREATKNKEPAKPQGSSEKGTYSFETAKGSTYTHKGNITQRYKVSHVGHDPKDVGLKEWSAHTVYVDPEHAKEVGLWNTGSSSSGTSVKKRIILSKDHLHITSMNPVTGKRGLDGKFPYETKPRLGLSPVELFQPEDTDGHTGFRGNHPGNAIVKLTEHGKKEEVSTPAQKEEKPKQLVVKKPSTKSVIPESKKTEQTELPSAQAEKGSFQPQHLGSTATTHMDDGTKVKVRYALVEAHEPIASHDTEFNVNPQFPAELQPRNRSRVGSEKQVQDIRANFSPELLGANPKTSEGAPTLGPEGAVEIGNGRMIAMRRIYDENGQNAKDYRNWLKENAGDFGLEEGHVAAMKNPLLVKLRTTDVDRKEFVQATNKPSAQVYSPSEHARSDARFLTPQMMELFNHEATAGIGAAENRDFVRAFVGNLASQESEVYTSSGALSQKGAERIRHALFYRAYENMPLSEKLSEEIDASAKTVTNALAAVSPRIAALRGRMEAGTLHNIDMIKDIVGAARRFDELKKRGASIPEYLANQDLLSSDLTPEGKEILGALDSYSQKSGTAQKIRGFLNGYADYVERAGDPREQALFGIKTPSMKQAALKAALASADQQKEEEKAASWGRRTKDILRKALKVRRVAKQIDQISVAIS